MWQSGIALTIAALIGLDQVTKWLADTYCRTPLPLWENVFELTYVENRGAAWGLGQGGRWVFVAITAVAMCAVLWAVFSGWTRQKHVLLTVAGVLIAAGGIGNLIDRVRNGYVVDFLYAKCIDFPVFNVADCCVVIGAALLIVWLLFLYKEPHKEVADGTDTTDGDTAGSGSAHRQGGRAELECDAGDSAKVAGTGTSDGQRETADQELPTE